LGLCLWFLTATVIRERGGENTLSSAVTLNGIHAIDLESSVFMHAMREEY
jgi:hypothetical protein